MAELLELGPEEQGSVREALQTLARKWPRPSSLAAMLNKWRSLVAEVERGYRFTVYDFTNDLVVRDRLDELARILPDVIRGKLELVLRPIDERFIGATESRQRPLLDRSGFWWSRVPTRRDRDFDTDDPPLRRLK